MYKPLSAAESGSIGESQFGRFGEESEISSQGFSRESDIDMSPVGSESRRVERGELPGVTG